MIIWNTIIYFVFRMLTNWITNCVKIRRVCRKVIQGNTFISAACCTYMITMSFTFLFDATDFILITFTHAFEI